MKDANRNYIATGAFVLVMLAVLIAWIAVLSGSTTSTDSYYIKWNNVMGLKPGTQILFEGYQIGLIDSIGKAEGAQTGGKNYRVDIEIEKGWPIPKGSIAQTASPTVLAALIVNIVAGDSTELISPGSEIPGKEQGDLLAAAGDAMSSVSDILEYVKPVLEEIATSVSTILSQENADQIKSLLETLNTRVGEILSAQNAANIENIITNLNQVTVDVSELTVGLKGTKAEVDRVLAAVTTLMDERKGELGHALADLHASLEAVSRHIDSITSNLDQTMRNANEFSLQIRENPGVLLRGRDVEDDSRASR